MVRVGVDLRLDELVIEVVAFAGALADAGEDRIAAMGLGDVVDQFLDEHRLADARAAEEADLAALSVRREQVDDLDAGDKDLGFRRLLDIGGGRLMDRAAIFHLDRPGFVDRLADDVHDAPERALADGNGDRPAGVGHLLAAHEALRDVHRDAAHRVLAELLGHLEHQAMAVVVVSSALRIGGRSPSNCTSTTAPITWVTRPVAFAILAICDVLVFNCFSPPRRRVAVRAPRRPR